METSGYTVSGSGVADGHWHRSIRGIGGFAPGAGVNVNNNFDNANDNNGAAPVLPAEILSMSLLGFMLSRGRTSSTRQSSFQSPEAWIEFQDIAIGR